MYLCTMTEFISVAFTLSMTIDFFLILLKYTMKDVEKETCAHCADEITDVA